LRGYLEEVVPRSVRRADFIIADSENTRNDLVVLLGVNPASIAVVPGGVEDRFRPVTEPEELRQARRHLGVGDSPFVLAIGVLEPRKNLNRLMDAFLGLKQRSGLPSDLKLVLAGGKGWLFDGIFEHHAASPIRDDILLPGFVPDALLPAMYSAAAVLAFPSLYEGFGLPLLEAMACGTPVVASRASCLPEVADDAAVLIDPNDVDALTDALEQAIGDPALRARLIEQGRQRVAQYSWRRAAEQLLEVYQKVAAA
jgi:glycosyltransferase involved in cell wall biosynthesis